MTIPSVEEQLEALRVELRTTQGLLNSLVLIVAQHVGAAVMVSAESGEEVLAEVPKRRDS